MRINSVFGSATVPLSLPSLTMGRGAATLFGGAWAFRGWADISRFLSKSLSLRYCWL